MSSHAPREGGGGEGAALPPPAQGLDLESEEGLKNLKGTLMLLIFILLGKLLYIYRIFF